MPVKEQPDARKSITKSISLPVEMWAGISDYRYANRIPTEAEAIRRLLDEVLALHCTGKAA